MSNKIVGRGTWQKLITSSRVCLGPENHLFVTNWHAVVTLPYIRIVPGHTLLTQPLASQVVPLTTIIGGGIRLKQLKPWKVPCPISYSYAVAAEIPTIPALLW